MSRFMALLVSILLILGCAAVAQDAPKAEIFGGYQYVHANSGVSGVDGFNLNGWNASLSGYFNKNFGITGDFSGSYGSPFGVSVKFYTYTFGPVVRFPNSSKITPFAHALFGGGHISGSALGLSASDSGFTWLAGGGLDANLSSKVAIRVAQFDFVQTRIGGDNQNNFRYSGGIVFKF